MVTDLFSFSNELLQKTNEDHHIPTEEEITKFLLENAKNFLTNK